MTEVDALLATLRQRSEWGEAKESFAELWHANGQEAITRAREYADVYAGNRAAMVLDVVLSRQRNYRETVVPIVSDWMTKNPKRTLAALAANGPGRVKRLRSDNRLDEVQVTREVAKGLSCFAKAHGLSDDAGVAEWAKLTEPLRFGWRADPWVGNIKGIGLALFAYLRMRSGADALKPDARVQGALERRGLVVWKSPLAALLIAEGLTRELGISRLQFDQLLWFDESARAPSKVRSGFQMMAAGDTEPRADWSAGSRGANLRVNRPGRFT